MSLTCYGHHNSHKKSVRIIASEDTHTLNIIQSMLYYSTI